MEAHIEIERKYIIETPCMETLCKTAEYSRSDILQIYISAPAGVTHRIRSRDFGDVCVYTETVKRRIDKMSALEEEREITKPEFDALARRIKDGTRPIHKSRHTFVYSGRTFEIDIYPEWKNTCILETELPSRDTAVDFPQFIRTVREVTGDKSYSNASMAVKFPKESEL